MDSEQKPSVATPGADLIRAMVTQREGIKRGILELRRLDTICKKRRIHPKLTREEDGNPSLDELIALFAGIYNFAEINNLQHTYYGQGAQARIDNLRIRVDVLEEILTKHLGVASDEIEAAVKLRVDRHVAETEAAYKKMHENVLGESVKALNAGKALAKRAQGGGNALKTVQTSGN